MSDTPQPGNNMDAQAAFTGFVIRRRPLLVIIGVALLLVGLVLRARTIIAIGAAITAIALAIGGS